MSRNIRNKVDLWSDKIEKMLTGVRYVVNNGQNLVRLVYKIAGKLFRLISMKISMI